MTVPPALQPLVDRAPDALVVLDFDGTISTIVDHPGDATAVAGVIDTLSELTRFVTVAFVTGRPVEWLVDRTRPLADHGVEFIGLHGHERLHGADVVPHPESAPWRETIELVEARVKAAAPADVVVERKGLALALHYRTSPGAEQWIRTFCDEVERETGLVAHDTRYSVELRPPVELDKGDAMRLLIDEHRPKAVVFFGDDLVDIPAVEAMRSYAEIPSAAVFVDSLEGPRAFAEIADVVLTSPAAAADALRAVLKRLRADA
ncbi:MAG TPA: trehalose-phosphatase [Acidimicrobiales bacterium]|nr:trehalose-phosphatase [Acidimicrobiales bacterium]